MTLGEKRMVSTLPKYQSILTSYFHFVKLKDRYYHTHLVVYKVQESFQQRLQNQE